MFGQRRRSDSRWEVCLCFVHFVVLLTIVRSYDPCPESSRHSPGAQAPSISEDEIETAFSVGAQNVEKKNQTRNSVRVYPKGLKTPETIHPQADQTPEIFQMEKKQLVFDETTQLLKYRHDLSPLRVTCGLPQIFPTGDLAEKAQDACVSTEEIFCDSTSRYRTADGSCNNPDNPTFGRAFSPYSRLLVPNSRAFEDGNRKETENQCAQKQLPNPRYISEAMQNSTGKLTAKANNLYVVFGQFLSHDITSTAQTTTGNNEAIQCCPQKDDDHPQCAPIEISNKHNSPFAKENITCMNFVRSAIYPSCTLGYRTQINKVTSFIDGSQIYGTSQSQMNSLRATDGTGKLLVQNSRFGPLLPPSSDPTNDRCSYPEKNQTCFRSGDNRVNDNPLLTSMYTIWIREHNRVATKLKELNPHWTGDKIFQESRRIVIAEMQVIVMAEYLSLTLGNEWMKENRYLNFWNSPQETTYMKELNPNIMTEFSTAAFRFGHSMIHSTLTEMPKRLGHNGHLLRDVYSTPFGLTDGEIDLVTMGASRTPAQGLDRSLVTDVTNFLYRTPGKPTGLDLAAMNIQRGRDHDLPNYAEFYKICNSQRRVESFYDLEERHLMTAESISFLRNLYGKVSNVELWPGILSEVNMHDAILGPIGQCIFGEQFRRLISGDRYWSTHINEAGSFTPNQLWTLRTEISLAGIICANTNVTEIPRSAMELPSNTNSISPCRQVRRINLDHWKEN